MTVNIHAARKRLSVLDARVEKGERITVARVGTPVAQLVPLPRTRGARLPQDDPLLNLKRFGFDGPGGTLTAEESDRIVS